MVNSPPIQTAWQRQETLVYLLLTVLLLFTILSARIAYQYMLPQPHWINLGNTADFPPGQPIRIATESRILWVIQQETGFLVLNAVPNDQAKCPVYWEAERGHFADPCRGSRYSIHGLFWEGPAPTRSLDAYPTQIDANGELSVDVTKPILGQHWQYFQEQCAALGSALYPVRDHQWLQECDINRIMRP